MNTATIRTKGTITMPIAIRVPTGNALHHDWRFLVAVFLMLVGIAIYVITLDFRAVPRGQLPPRTAGSVNK